MSTHITLVWLMPCPFCHSSAVFMLTDLGEITRYFVQCADCGTESKDAARASDAAKAWNHQASAPRHTRYCYKDC
ncbi:Lar family restriction alleviation protein [Enterovibrio coralii]|uniref:Restriction alleviation protein, Lar family n=1 Tax=Enterovibrio coralii TaxID=294935 RepID=A0A135I6Z4_9GAMM|nr:hypothetical protein ATN88_00115 [Enterovibrio coralii]